MDSLSLVNSFYDSFQRKDAKGMIRCYTDDVVFEDPAFGELKGDEAKAMWRMLINKGGDSLQVNYKVISYDLNTVTVHWEAKYPFGPNKRQIHNQITAHILVKDGKIIKHTDQFDLWRWARQAFGVPGILLGWTPMMKAKIQTSTKSLLQKYIEKTG